MTSHALPRRARLGAILPDDRETFRDGGAWLSDVEPGGMAASAGLRGGDRLSAVAGVRVSDLASLAEALRAAATHDQVELAFERDGEPRTSIARVERRAMREGVRYGELECQGARLRTIIDAPQASVRAWIVWLAGIACESVEDHPVLDDLVAAWVASGLAVLRFDKRGVGDSQSRDGLASAVDFATEHADVRAALVHARTLAGALPLVAFGHSVGAIHAALHARFVDAVAVYGAPVMPWLECVRASVRRQLELRRVDEADIARQVAEIDELCLRGQLNGRSASYHRQLAACDVAAAWRAVDVPVLVVRGEHDWVVDAEEQAHIANLAPSETTIVDVAGFDHLLGWHPDREASLRDYGNGGFDRAVVDATLGWLDRVSSRA
jgi:alpha-beta hydrolase superfamily lysophospholipase